MNKRTKLVDILLFGAAATALVLAHARVADAGGLARPNPVSARSVGMGGAFSAVADDPTALHFNPAGLARIPRSNLLIGGEFVIAPRTYKPSFADGRCDTDPSLVECREQSPSAPVRPLPSLGFATRLTREGIPSRLTFGIGVWNTFGGQLEYSGDECETCGPADMDGNPTDNRIPGTLLETRNAVIEIVPGAAYEVNDVLAIGAAFRLGVGLFDTVAYKDPNSATLSATGVGAGATFGVMVTPSKKLDIGAYYRTALTVTTKGDGTIFQDTGDVDVKVEFDQEWPQQMGIALAFKPVERLLLAAQWDWHGWSRMNKIAPIFAGQTALTAQAEIDLDWQDSWALHLGTQYDLTDSIQARAGFTFDSTAVTERFRERQFLDGNALLFAGGGSYSINTSWRIDTAFEIGPGGSTTIDDNSADASMLWPARPGKPKAANAAPGEHDGQLYTLELALQYLY